MVVETIENSTGCQNAAIGLDRYSIVPVSYTHLRAHETVLDLVCRLLIEKKKQTNKKKKHTSYQQQLQPDTVTLYNK